MQALDRRRKVRSEARGAVEVHVVCRRVDLRCEGVCKAAPRVAGRGGRGKEAVWRHSEICRWRTATMTLSWPSPIFESAAVTSDGVLNAPAATA